MAGIYIHIPFCKKKCTYCDFYAKVAPKFITTVVDSIVSELHMRKNYLQNAAIKTIYFGGGTPSILKPEEFQLIFETIYSLFSVCEDAEVTFEANPDDLTTEYLNSVNKLPFNRISIGIQSFDNEDLNRINRRHTAKEAIEAVHNAQKARFNNISIDLIYGLPFQSIEAWDKQLEIAMNLDIQHISAYGLTYEEGTVLWKQKEKGKLKIVDDETMNAMYLLLRQKTKEHNFEAYEISNFSLPGYRSRHNTSYWNQEPYLGIGPSAHSYNLISRQWNVASIQEYIKLIGTNTVCFEREELSLYDRYNDYIMVSLRTSDGLDMKYIEQEFGSELVNYCTNNAKTFIDTGKVINRNGKLYLTPNGIMISNLIFIQLMRV